MIWVWVLDDRMYSFGWTIPCNRFNLIVTYHPLSAVLKYSEHTTYHVIRHRRDQQDFRIPVFRWWNQPLNQFWPHTGFFHCLRGKAGSLFCKVLQTPGPKSTAHTESTNSRPFQAGRWCHLSPPYCNTMTCQIKERKPQRCVPLGSDEAFFSFPSGKWRLCVGRPVSRIHLLPSFNGVINKEKSLESIKNTAPNSHVTLVYEKEANALLSKS